LSLFGRHCPPSSRLLTQTLDRMIILLLPLLLGSAYALQIPFLPSPPSPPLHTLTLRHALHLSTTNRSFPILHRHYSSSDLLSLSAETGYSTTQSLSSIRTSAWRPNSQHAYQAARRASFFTPRALARRLLPTWQELEDEALGATLEWREHEIEMPNVTDVKTLAALAKMASNAYIQDDNSGWWDMEGKWNVVSLGPDRNGGGGGGRLGLMSPLCSLTRLAGSKMVFEDTFLPIRPILRLS
jgi:hypothetical protein